MRNKRYLIPRVYCGARTRLGSICRQPAMKNGRCRLHGGPGLLAGKAHGRYVHGRGTKEAIELQRQLKQLLREGRKRFLPRLGGFT